MIRSPRAALLRSSAKLFFNQRRLHIVLLAVLVALSSCTPHTQIASDTIIVPQEVPIGTVINVRPLRQTPNHFVVMVVGDCTSCTSQVLKLRRHKKELARYVVTAHTEAQSTLKREWPGLDVIVDDTRKILPDYCYSVTPQMFLVDGNRIVDGAVGAMDCSAKWDRWNP